MLPKSQYSPGYRRQQRQLFFLACASTSFFTLGLCFRGPPSPYNISFYSSLSSLLLLAAPFPLFFFFQYIFNTYKNIMTPTPPRAINCFGVC